MDDLQFYILFNPFWEHVQTVQTRMQHLNRIYTVILQEFLCTVQSNLKRKLTPKTRIDSFLMIWTDKFTGQKRVKFLVIVLHFYT